MRNKSITILSLLFVILSKISFAEGYEINIKILGVKDTNAYLAHYFDGRIFADDTTRLDIEGKGVFTKKKELQQGIYVVYLPDQKYFDVLIGEDQEFLIETNMEDFIANMSISGADETKAFNEFQQFMNAQNKSVKKLQQDYKRTKGEDSKEKFRIAFKIKDEKVREYISNLEKSYTANSFISKFAKFTVTPQTPDFKNIFPESDPERNKKIQQKTYTYSKDHYFDNTDFTDDRLLRTPILKNKLEQFFNKILVQTPDSIVKEAVKIIEKSRPNKDFFQYLVQFTLNNSIKSKIMGMDAAFVSLARKYYLSGEASWADSTTLANIRERVFKLQFNLVGQKSRDIKMETPEGEYVTLHEVDAKYTVLYFWEPSCGHCKKTTPKLKNEIYDIYHDRGVEVFAVYTQDDKKEWEDFIADYDLFDLINCYDPQYHSNFRIFYDIHSTPSIYLLDKDKNIIAKRIDIDILKRILDSELSVEK